MLSCLSNRAGTLRLWFKISQFNNYVKLFIKQSFIFYIKLLFVKSKEDFLVFKDTHDVALNRNPTHVTKNQFSPAKDPEIFIQTSNSNPHLAPDFLKSKSEDNLKKSPYTVPAKPNAPPKIIPTSNIMTSDKFFELNKDALIKPKTKFCDASKEPNLVQNEGSSKDLKNND